MSLFYSEFDSTASPCGTPRMWYPFSGDSMFSNRDIVLLNASNAYVRVPYGTGYNIQPFSYNQQTIMFDQEFMVPRNLYVPMQLNTRYNTAWATGWQNTLVNLANCFLVEEGPLHHVGGGIVRFYRRFSSLPPTRNVVESYAATFPALNYGSDTSIRFGKTRIVNSRVQYDYLVFDPSNLLQFGLFPGGPRLNMATGINPLGIILQEMRYFKSEVDAVTNNNLLDSDQPLTDDPATVPTYTQYRGFAGFDGSAPAEIVAESSSLRQWVGNIYERKTRFVIPQ